MLKLVDLGWEVPDYSTLCRRQKTLSVPLNSKGPLHLLVESTRIDEQTLEIRPIEATGSNIGDAPMVPDLLSQIAPDPEIGSATADGAYDSVSAMRVEPELGTLRRAGYVLAIEEVAGAYRDIGI